MKIETKKVTRRKALTWLTITVAFATLAGCDGEDFKIDADDVDGAIGTLHNFPLTFPFILG